MIIFQCTVENQQPENEQINCDKIQENEQTKRDKIDNALKLFFTIKTIKPDNSSNIATRKIKNNSNCKTKPCFNSYMECFNEYIDSINNNDVESCKKNIESIFSVKNIFNYNSIKNMYYTEEVNSYELNNIFEIFIEKNMDNPILPKFLECISKTIDLETDLLSFTFHLWFLCSNKKTQYNRDLIAFIKNTIINVINNTNTVDTFLYNNLNSNKLHSIESYELYPVILKIINKYYELLIKKNNNDKSIYTQMRKIFDILFKYISIDKFLNESPLNSKNIKLYYEIKLFYCFYVISNKLAIIVDDSTNNKNYIEQNKSEWKNCLKYINKILFCKKTYNFIIINRDDSYDVTEMTTDIINHHANSSDYLKICEKIKEIILNNNKNNSDIDKILITWAKSNYNQDLQSICNKVCNKYNYINSSVNNMFNNMIKAYNDKEHINQMSINYTLTSIANKKWKNIELYYNNLVVIDGTVFFSKKNNFLPLNEKSDYYGKTIYINNKLQSDNFYKI